MKYLSPGQKTSKNILRNSSPRHFFRNWWPSLSIWSLPTRSSSAMKKKLMAALVGEMQPMSKRRDTVNLFKGFKGNIHIFLIPGVESYTMWIRAFWARLRSWSKMIEVVESTSLCRWFYSREETCSRNCGDLALKIIVVVWLHSFRGVQNHLRCQPGEMSRDGFDFRSQIVKSQSIAKWIPTQFLGGKANLNQHQEFEGCNSTVFRCIWQVQTSGLTRQAVSARTWLAHCGVFLCFVMGKWRVSKQVEAAKPT